MHFTVSVDTSTRQWRLEGYVKGESKKPAHTSVCIGDRALDDAMLRLEARDDIRRIVVKPA